MLPIVLMGPSGCGKTTIASIMHREIGCPFIEGDDFHSQHNISKMASGIPLTDDDREPWLEHIHAAVTEARSMHKYAPIIVTCFALKRRYREILSRPPNNDILFVFLDAPHEVLETRVSQRKGHFFPTNIIPSQLEILEVPRKNEENCLSIDATLNPEEIVSRILAHLKSA